MAHPQYSATSDTFCCKWCGADVALAEEIGGDLAYICTAANCGHACMVDAPEGLGIKPVAASWSSSAEPAGDDTGEPGPHDPAEERAPLDAAARKAAWHASQGVAPVAHAGGHLVPSGTRAGVVHYVSADGVCSCEAGQHGKRCWHREIVALGAGRHLVAA